MFDQHSLSLRVAERDFVIERQFAASRARMFAMFTEPEHLTRWWAPRPYTISACTVDLRPGGIWHYGMRSPEGRDHWARSVYTEVVPPQRLAYTSTFADADANPVPGMPEHLTTVTFTEEAGGTRVAAHVQFDDAAALQTAVALGMTQGMSMTWDELAVYVSEPGPA
jgi:uncharacterized protein YndB with AHSA1/START domain